MTAPITLTVGGTDITSHVRLDSIVVTESGCRQAGHLECDVADVASALTLAAKAQVQLWDNNDARYVFTGYLNPTDINALGTGRSFHLSCDDLGEVLDTSLVPSESRPAESFLARLTYGIQTYGPRLPQTFTKIENLAGTLPAALYENTTLRGYIEMTCSLAGTTVDYFVGGDGLVNAGTALLGAAPFAFRVGTPGGGEITPEEPFTITRDPKQIVNAYYIRGANAAGSGWVTNGASIAIYGRIESYADAPDADTGTKRDAVGNALLADNATSSLIGKAHVTAANGFRPGQTLTIVNAPQFDITSSQDYRVNLVTRHYSCGGTMKTYDLQFGGLVPMWSTSIPTPQSWPGQRIARGSLSITPFADNIRPVAIVASLPSLPDAAYPLDSYVVLTTDHKLYQNVANVWVNAVTTGLPVGFSGIPSVGTLPALPSTSYPVGIVVFLTTDGKLYRNVANAWTKAVDGGDIAAGSLGLTPFASAIRPVAIVATLPSLPDTAYPDGSTILLTTDHKLYRNNAGTWTKAVDGGDISAATLGLTPFASSIRPVVIVATLPSLPDTAYPIGSTVVLTWDGKLYRNVAGAWSRAVDGGDIVADSITAAQISAGAIGASELAANAITAGNFAGNPRNLVADPGWEIGGFWAGGGRGTSAPHRGTYNGFLTTTDQVMLSGTFGVEGGRRYSISGWARGNSSNTSAFAITLQIRWLSAAGGEISRLNVASVALGQTNTYELLTNVLVAPAAAVYAYIVWVNGGFGDATANCYFDDCDVHTADEDVSHAGGNVTIDQSGITVASGAISVKNSAGTTILDVNGLGSGVVGAAQIVADSITAGQIAAGAIGASEIAAHAVTAAAIAAGTITATEIAAATITGDRLVAGTIQAAEIAAGTITGDRIAAATIAGSNMIADTVTAGQIAAGAIGASEIAANAITAAAIAAGAITADKLAVGSRQGSITNPDFSLGPVGVNNSVYGWTTYRAGGVGTIQIDTASVCPGGHAAWIINGMYNAYSYIRSSRFAVLPGETLAISLMASGSGGLAVQAEWWDAAGGSLGYSTALTVSALSGGFGRYPCTVLVISGAVYCTLVMYASTSGTVGGTAIIGDVQVSFGSVLAAANGSVLITSDGVAITNGKLTVTNGSSVVIIDGTSDMFKITATATVTTSSFANPGSNQAHVDVTTGFAYVPLIFFNTGGAPVPDFLDDSNGHWLDKYSGYAENIGGGVTRIYVTTKSSRSTGTTAAAVYRYYLLQEVAI